MHKHLTLLTILFALLFLSGCHNSVRNDTDLRTASDISGVEFRETASEPAHAACSTSISNCPAQGCGDPAHIDEGTNRQKNRTAAPANPVQLTVAGFKQQFPELTAMGTSRKHVSTHDAQTLQVDEAIDVEVEGYILDDAREDIESCNCYLANALDYHVWLGETNSSNKEDSIVVEVTPRLHDTSSTAVANVMKRLKSEKAHVRVLGWPMFDPLHPDEVRHTRFTRWEIHPVVDIQEEVSGHWHSVFN